MNIQDIKTKVNENPVLRNTVRIGTDVLKAIAVGLVIRAGTYIVVEGTKALINEVSANVNKRYSAE